MFGLKSAIVTTNSNSQDDTINLATNVSAGTGSYTLSSVDNATSGPNGLPVITADGVHTLTINGNGATIWRSTSSGTPDFRILFVGGASATINALTLRNGNLSTTNNFYSDIGAGFYSTGTAALNSCTITGNSAPNGGGIYNASVLTLTNCAVSDNPGGGIFNNQTATMTGCTVSGNGGVGISNGEILTMTGCTVSGNAGPGIYDIFSISVDLANCTLSGNNTAGLTQAGGAIYSTSAGHRSVTACTISDNRDPFGGTILLSSGSLSIANTILQGGIDNAVNAPTTITSYGYNLSTDNAGGFLTGPGDQITTDPKLDPAGLQDNGGPTQTIALTSGSPAIDKGNRFGLATDQRGFARPFDNPAIVNAAGGDGSDIGAYEAPADQVQFASPLVVTTAADHDDGTCGGTDCTLREAVARANNPSLHGSYTITFGPAVTGTIVLATTELAITGPMTITGPGARVLAISGNGAHRVFNLSAGINTISGLTIQGGWQSGSSGSGDSAAGGGVYNQTTLTLNDCTLNNNSASGANNLSNGGAGGAAQGGAIYNNGSLTLNRCTFNRDSVTGNANAVGGGAGGFNSGPVGFGGAGGVAQGGAVFNNASATLILSNCTFGGFGAYGNAAGGGQGGTGHFGGNGGAGSGGAIFNLGTMTVTACTISGNQVNGGAGGSGSVSINNGAMGASKGALATGGGTSTVRTALIAGNTGNSSATSDVDGAFTSAGYNLVGSRDNSTGFTGTADQGGTNAAPINAQLGPLQNNGGPTDTMALLAGSPALDQGKAFGLTIDQRGQPRPLDNFSIANASGGDGSDIGAFEIDTPQGGATLIVTTNAEHDDGVCSFTDCTLREAIVAANALAGDNTITFANGVTGIIQLTSALANLSTNITVQGPGANLLTVRNSNNGSYRIFTISNGTSVGPVVSISGLTIANGNAFGPGGGGILNDRGTLTLSSSALTGNAALTVGGGALLNDTGTLTMQACTLSGNSAGFGGGLYNRSVAAGTVATATVNNCTVSGNSAIDSYGGGILNTATSTGSATMNVRCSTVSGNNAANPTLGGGIHNRRTTGGTATTTLGSTLFKTGTTGSNIVNDTGTITSLGYNLSSDAATGPYLIQATDRTSINPLIGALANNGGPTQTHALQTGSPAFDTGKNFGLATDQRGLPRTADASQVANASGGDGTDIGAFEINPSGGSEVDSEPDGMADEFELFYGVNNPGADNDGDGLTNLQEFKAGTNPLDATSGLRITTVARNTNDFVVTFNTAVAGKSYRLERKDALTDALWGSISGVADLNATSTGSAQITDTGGATTTTRFYHVRVLP